MNPDKVGIKKAERLLKGIPNGSKRAVTNATNRALTKGRMTVNKDIREKFTIKATSVKESLKIYKANFSRLNGKVEVKSPVTMLNNFKFSPRKRTKKPKDVYAEIIKGQKKRIPHAYLSSLGGQTIIVARLGKERTPNRMLTGPSIPYMAKETDISDHVQKEMLDVFNTRLNHEIKRILSK